MHSNDPKAQIRKQVMWNRLLAIVEEQAQTLIRSSFSTTVREAGDLSAGIFDAHGRMLAQAVTGTPGHVNSMATAVPHFLAEYPLESMSAGDSYITNDPWLTSGHLHDLTVVTPVFFNGVGVALFAATIHVVDIGGRGLGTEGRQIFEEGLFIPIMPLARRGEMNKDLLRILHANNREPIQVEGDVFSLAAAGEDGANRLLNMMREFEIEDLTELAQYIIENSRAAMLAAIQKLPEGTYYNAMTLDGYEAPVTVHAALTVSDNGIHVDYEGTSPASPYGINVVLNYTAAYSCFGVKCVIAPDVPNNFGSMSLITVSAPENSILNVQKPAPVAARHIVGHMTPDVIVGCLHHAAKDVVTAESGNGWNPMLRGSTWFDETQRIWEIYLFFSGGMGARTNKDGLSTTQFPAGVSIIPIEAAEATSPILFWRKELLMDSGGAGKYRGGLGQVLEIATATHGAIAIQAMFDRIRHPARGREGGQIGAAGRVLKAGSSKAGSSQVLAAKGQHQILPNEILRLELPGGGGFGDPYLRHPDAVVDDVAEGLVSRDAAEKVYGVIVDADGNINAKATANMRRALANTG